MFWPYLGESTVLWHAIEGAIESDKSEIGWNAGNLGYQF